MKQEPRGITNGAKYAAPISVLCLVGASALLFFLQGISMYVPFYLPMLLLLLPTGINSVLLIPLYFVKRGPKASPFYERSESETQTTKKGKIRRVIKRVSAAFGRFFVRYKTVVLTMSILALMVLCNVFFWRYTKQTAVSSLLDAYMPFLLLAVFFLFLIFGKWCKHSVPSVDNTEEASRTVRYEVAILRNLQSVFALGRVALLITMVFVALRVFDVWDGSRLLVILLSVLFVYETVFLTISLFVVLVRRDMQNAPEITVPMPGVEYGDLGIINYLEKNTGISMRSLWSITMVKKTLPYACLLSVLLLWGATGVVMIGSDQQGAYYHFGKLQEEPLTAGLHMTLPWPFDEVEVYNTATVNKMTVGYVAENESDNLWTEAHGSEEYRLLVGGGKELVSINLRVEYRIADLYSYLTCSAAPELLMSAASYEIVTAHTITSDLDTLLSTDRTAFAQMFETELTTYMTGYDTGLEVVSVVLESIHPPVEVAEAYQALISAGIEAEKTILDAESAAAERIAWAWVSYDTETALAKIDQYEKIAEASGAVSEFMASVEADQANSEAYRYYKYLQAISDAYSDAKLIIVGDGVDQSNIYIGNIGK